MRIQPGFIYVGPVNPVLKTSLVTSFDLGSHVVRYTPIDGVLYWVAGYQTVYKFEKIKTWVVYMEKVHYIW